MRHHRCKLGHIINVVQGTLSITDTGKTIFTVKMEFSSGVYSVLVCQRNTRVPVKNARKAVLHLKFDRLANGFC